MRPQDVSVLLTVVLATTSLVQGYYNTGSRTKPTANDDEDDFGAALPAGEWAPASFGYNVQDPEDGGSHGHTASSDSKGHWKGSYTLQLGDGRTRTVDYTADDTGFHATITTNEPGTKTSNPADANIQSDAPQEKRRRRRRSISQENVDLLDYLQPLMRLIDVQTPLAKDLRIHE